MNHPWSCLFSIPELLSLVFIHCLPDNGYAQPDSTTFPVTLVFVCRKWREIAYATPQLWSCIDMALGRHFCHPTDEIADKQLLVLNSWIGRCGSMPLNLHLSYGGGEDELEGRILAPVLSTSKRWLQLDVTACFESIQAILEHMGRDAPLLEDVTLSSTSHRRSGNTASNELRLHLRASQRLERFVCSGSHRLQVDATDLPSSLKVLKIAYSTISIPRHTQLSPCSNVRQLSLVRVSCSNASNLLDMLGSAFRNVEELKLEIVGTTGTIASIPRLRDSWAVELARLRTMQYKANFYDIDYGHPLGINMTAEAAFLSRLYLPALTDLTFSVFTEDVLEQLASLFRRSRPPLTNLKLLGFIPTSFDVRGFLLELPWLTHLHIGNATHNEDVTKTVLTALTVHSAAPPPTSNGRLNLDEDATPEPTPESLNPLCPRLTHFEFAVWTSRITPNYVTDMILSRCNSSDTVVPRVVPLQRFALSLLPSNAQAVLQHPDISECIKNGLKLECYK